MSRRTAIAAPPAEPFDELFAAIDQMSVGDLAVFVKRFRERYDIPSAPTVRLAVRTSATVNDPDMLAWIAHMNSNGWTA
jgi:ribosomal protein L7/L12